MMVNKGDLVFEGIASDIYVMAANRFGEIDCSVYSQMDFDDLKRMGYTIEIRDVVSEIK